MAQPWVYQLTLALPGPEDAKSIMVRGVDLREWVAYQPTPHTASTDQSHSESQLKSPLPALEPHPLTSRPPVLCLGFGFTLPSASP